VWVLTKNVCDAPIGGSSELAAAAATLPANPTASKDKRIDLKGNRPPENA
jgi:hypothetical protein